MKKLVGSTLIRQNRQMWTELRYLQQILADFQQQNDVYIDHLRNQAQLCASQHRDFLRGQAKMLLAEARTQALDCGYSLEDVLPELKDPQLAALENTRKRSKAELLPRNSFTPSTRSPSSSACSTPEPMAGMPLSLSLGRALGIDEISTVAKCIREALEEEREVLLSAINEQSQYIEDEMARQASEVKGIVQEGASATKLQQFIRKLQSFTANPVMRALSRTLPPPGSAGSPERCRALQDTEMPDTETGMQILGMQTLPASFSGASNVRRIRALIAHRRRAVSRERSLCGVPEAFSNDFLCTIPQHLRSPEKPGFSGGAPELFSSDQLHGISSLASTPSTKPWIELNVTRSLDPFFDDPFAVQGFRFIPLRSGHCKPA